MPETIVRSLNRCYLSTPAHIHSFAGKFFYVCIDRGKIHLSDRRLLFEGKINQRLEIALDSIKDLHLGHYSRWAKPIRLDYISVSYRDEGVERTALLTPTRPWMTPTWETNKIVAEWLELIRRSIAKQAVWPRPFDETSLPTDAPRESV